MNSHSIYSCPFFKQNPVRWFVGLCVMILVANAVAQGQIEGFTEPFRKIDLSSDESGAISSLNIEEGQWVAGNAIVAKLDSSVQEIQLEIAKHLAESKSEVLAAEESFKKRESIHGRIQQLQAKGHATDSERLRSAMELSIAKARMLSAREDAEVRQIEYRRALMQLERRTIRAPFAGVVSKIHKREGEFISPVHPEIITLIQVDRLIAKFNVPSSQVQVFERGKKFSLQMYDGNLVEATVYSVGVYTDAQSGTVEVKLIVDNSNNELRAGEFLTLDI